MEESIRVVISKTSDESFYHVKLYELVEGVYILDPSSIGVNYSKKDIIIQILDKEEFYILKDNDTKKELLVIGIKNDNNLPIVELKITKR